jgi:hypothetical protein
VYPSESLEFWGQPSIDQLLRFFSRPQLFAYQGEEEIEEFKKPPGANDCCTGVILFDII